MKKLLTISVLVFLFGISFGQVTVVNTIDNSGSLSTSGDLAFCESQDLWVLTTANTIKIYNYKTGSVVKLINKYKMVIDNFRVQIPRYTSQHLFNSDDKWEFLMNYNNNLVLVNEDGVTLQTFPGFMGSVNRSGGQNPTPGIISDDVNSYLVVQELLSVNNYKFHFYKLNKNINTLIGAVGPKGEQGIQGLQGIQGIKGDKGDQGIQGEQGVKGDAGVCNCNQTAISTKSESSELVNIFPNVISVGSDLNIQPTGMSQGSNITITSCKGIIISNFKYNSENDLQNIVFDTPGVYIVTVVDGDVKETHKIIVQ